MSFRAMFFAALVLVPTVGAAQEVPDAMSRDIVGLMEKTGARNLGAQMGAALTQQILNAMKASSPNIPARAIEIATEVTKDFTDRFINNNEVNDALVKLYAKHFTHDEIKELISIYSSPLGEKLISTMPQLTAESMQIAQQHIVPMLPELQQELARRFQAEGLTPAVQ